MDDLEEFIKKQGQFAEESAKAVSDLAKLVDLLTKRVIALEKDVNNIIENDYGVKRGKKNG